MKLMHLTFLIVCGFVILLLARPLDREKQAEEIPYEVEQILPQTYRLRLEIDRPQDRDISDIIWFQEAAQLALDKDVSGFNVLEQKITNDHIEGIIELETDPMKAEYSAHEILSLELGDN